MSETNPISPESEQIHIDPDLEKEHQPSVVVVLSSGSERKPNGIFLPKMDGKIRTIAAGVLASAGGIEQIIFSGGRTSGEENPSDAEIMRDYLWEYFPELVTMPTLLDEQSIDTSENAQAVARLLGKRTPVIVITNDYHIARASDEFGLQGLRTTSEPAEPLVAEFSEHHRKLMERYLKSRGVKEKAVRDAVLRQLMKFGPTREYINKLAHKQREGESVAPVTSADIPESNSAEDINTEEKI